MGEQIEKRCGGAERGRSIRYPPMTSGGDADVHARFREMDRFARVTDLGANQWSMKWVFYVRYPPDQAIRFRSYERPFRKSGAARLKGNHGRK